MNNIDHPYHYNHGTIEVIDVIEDWGLGFHLGNAVKYIGRAGYKGDAAEDIKKAIWYLQRYLDYIEVNGKESLITNGLDMEEFAQAAQNVAKRIMEMHNVCKND